MSLRPGNIVEIWVDSRGIFQNPFSNNRLEKKTCTVLMVDSSRINQTIFYVEVMDVYPGAILCTNDHIDSFNNCIKIENFDTLYYRKCIVAVNDDWIVTDPQVINQPTFSRNFVGYNVYSPRIQTRSLAVSALRALGNPMVDASIRASEPVLRAYAAEHMGTLPDLEVVYEWCGQCRQMIGYGNHFHCTSCGQSSPQNNQCIHCNSGLCCCQCVGKCRRCPKTLAATNQCRWCRSCSDCCQCNLCNNDCSALATCSECNSCRNCCNCHGTAIVSGKPWEANSPSHRTKFNCKRLIGVEWEYNFCEARPVSNWSKKWRAGIHRDGSCGMEAVTPPMAGNHVVNCLTDLGKAFSDGEATIDAKCGIHVHVDARDISWDDMCRLLAIYSKVEPALYLLAGEDRIANRYCAPVGTQYKMDKNFYDKKNRILSVALDNPNGRQGQRAKPGKKHASRYKSLNIMPWLAGRAKKAKDTTVEFRLHRNSSDANRIIGWAKLCCRIVDWTAKSTDSDVEKLPTSAMQALAIIAPDCKEWMLNQIQQWRKSKRAVRKIRFVNGVYAIAN